MKKGVRLIMGMPAADQELRTPHLAQRADIPGIVALAETTCESFPGFEALAFTKALTEAVARGEAWVFRVDNRITAATLYSKADKALGFLAVHPDFRRYGLAARLVETVAAQFPVGEKLSVTTYRAGDPLGTAAHAFYQALGFTEAENTEAFGYPSQVLTLIVPEGTPMWTHRKNGQGRTTAFEGRKSKAASRK